MARNYYSEINLHVVWHTKESAKLLTPKVEAIAHHYIRGRCINTSGVFIHEIGGTEDHLHLCVSILALKRNGEKPRKTGLQTIDCCRSPAVNGGPKPLRGKPRKTGLENRTPLAR